MTDRELYLEKQAFGRELIKRVVSGGWGRELVKRVVPGAGRAASAGKPPKNYQDLVSNLVRNIRGAKPISGAEAAKLGPAIDDLGVHAPLTAQIRGMQDRAQQIFGGWPEVRTIFSPERFRGKDVAEFLKMTGPSGLAIGGLGGAALGSLPGAAAGIPEGIQRDMGKYHNLAEYYGAKSKLPDRLRGIGAGIGGGAVIGGMLGGRRGLLRVLSKLKPLQAGRKKILAGITKRPGFGPGQASVFDDVLGSAMGEASLKIMGEGARRGAKGGALAGLLPGVGLGEGAAYLSRLRAESPKYKAKVHQRWGPFTYYGKDKDPAYKQVLKKMWHQMPAAREYPYLKLAEATMDKTSAGAGAMLLQKLLRSYYGGGSGVNIHKLIASAVQPGSDAPAAASAEDIIASVTPMMGKAAAKISPEMQQQHDSAYVKAMGAQMLGQMGLTGGYGLASGLFRDSGIMGKRQYASSVKELAATERRWKLLHKAMKSVRPGVADADFIRWEQGPAYDPINHRVQWHKNLPSEGILAHELGHATQGMNLGNPLRKVLAMRLPMMAGGIGGLLGTLGTTDEDKARKIAILGTALGGGVVGNEMHASYRGSKVLHEAMKNFSGKDKRMHFTPGFKHHAAALKKNPGLLRKLWALKSPWIGVPTYLAAATAPLQAHGLMKWFGGYDNKKSNRVLDKLREIKFT